MAIATRFILLSNHYIDDDYSIKVDRALEGNVCEVYMKLYDSIDRCTGLCDKPEIIFSTTLTHHTKNLSVVDVSK